MQKQQIIDEIITLSLERNIKTKDEFHKTQNEVYKKYKLPEGITGIDILERYNELIKTKNIKDSNDFRKVLRKRGVRSLSGVTVISLLTQNFPCPGKCVYCPTFDGLPKSYIPNEPAVQRAKLNEFDPIMQIHNRLRSLEITGHKIEKNDVRIIGGTWSCYPKKYQEDFIKGIYDAFNTYDEMKDQIDETVITGDKFSSFTMKEGYNLKLSKDLEEAKKINETAKYRVIGIAIETRPDWINPEEIARLRRYGITRVEIGYQTTNDAINILNKRGHTNKESINATRLLKDAGFKVVAHIMPNLLGSTPEIDKKSMQEVWDNPSFRPDEIKIYPMVVTDNSELTGIWRAGGFKAYDDETLINLMCDLEPMVPEYVRINRTYRDIPASEILHGSTLSNLRQIVEKRLEDKGIKLLEIRHREIKDKKNNPENAILHTLKYEASEGTEYFLTYEDPSDRTIFSLLRLRIPNTSPLDKGGKGDFPFIPYSKELKENSRTLRNNPTPAEKKVWYDFLRTLDIKILRQKPLLDYIVDFFIPSIGLIIEIDGDSHFQENYDIYEEKRTNELKKFGLEIIRFTNNEIYDNFENVCNIIIEKINSRKSPYPLLSRGKEKENPPTPLYQGGNKSFLPELNGAALIREIHTFGDQLSIGEAGSTFGQHIGFGKRLIAEAEKIALENGYKKIAVIAGVGVREYYKKRGYELEGEYMVKYL